VKKPGRSTACLRARLSKCLYGDELAAEHGVLAQRVPRNVHQCTAENNHFHMRIYSSTRLLLHPLLKIEQAQAALNVEAGAIILAARPSATTIRRTYGV
jgi:hypothetical protein